MYWSNHDFHAHDDNVCRDYLNKKSLHEYSNNSSGLYCVNNLIYVQVFRKIENIYVFELPAHYENNHNNLYELSHGLVILVVGVVEECYHASVMLT